MDVKMRTMAKNRTKRMRKWRTIRIRRKNLRIYEVVHQQEGKTRKRKRRGGVGIGGGEKEGNMSSI